MNVINRFISCIGKKEEKKPAKGGRKHKRNFNQSRGKKIKSDNARNKKTSDVRNEKTTERKPRKNTRNIRKKVPEKNLDNSQHDSNAEKVKAPKNDKKLANDKNTSSQTKEAKVQDQKSVTETKAPVEKPVRALNDPRYKSE